MAISVNSFKSDKRVFILFFCILLLNIFFISKGLHHTLSDRHEFRQTQTAITSYYFLHEGFTFDYKTPVLGRPWTIPFEFPLYQLVASFVCRITGLPLEVAGRVASMLFFYLSLLTSFLIMGMLKLTKSQGCIVLCFILINPVLLFWSRTFMIESTALFFSLAFVAAILAALQAYAQNERRFLLFMLCALALGITAGLVKITTFIVYFMVAGLFVLDTLYGYIKRKFDRRSLMLLVCSAIVFLVPIVITYLWVRHSDYEKSLSYLGTMITSNGLNSWNYGTLQQKVSPHVWKYISSYSFYGLPITILMLLLSYIFSLKHRKYIAIFGIPYVLTPLIFTNLYYIHDYYSFGNTILFSICCGLFLLSLADIKYKKYKLALASLCAVAIFTSLYFYFYRYYPAQKENVTAMQELGKQIKNTTSAGDILLVKGTDWSAVVPYYSERKAICLPDFVLSKYYLKDSTPQVDTLLKKLNEKIDEFVVVSDTLDRIDNRIIGYYNMNTVRKVTRANGGHSYFIFTSKKQ